MVGAVGAVGALVAPWYLLEPLFKLVVPVLPFGRNITISLITVVTIAVSLLFLVALLAVYGKTLTSLGANKPTIKHAGMALAGFAVYFVATIALQTIGTHYFQLNTDQPQELGYESLTLLEQFCAFIPLVLLTPLLEESLFRGFMFSGFRRHLPFWAAALGVSILFGLVHGQWNVGLDVFAMSFVGCYLVEKTKSLWPSIFLHMLKNGLAFYLLYLYNGG